MKITYEIKKKRGNWRPNLTITMIKEAWESDLLIPQVSVKTPFPQNKYKSNLNPKRVNIQEDSPPWTRFHTIWTPDANETEYAVNITLPWRPGAAPKYPEVPAILKALRRKYEEKLRGAYDSAPFETGGTLEMSGDCKKHVAPGVAARKMLKVVNAK